MRPGEFEWIEQLARRFGSGEASDGLVGIGDDAAVIPVGSTSPAGNALVISVDAQVEGIHYKPGWLGYHDLARRLLHVGFSDIAAMGASPLYALVSVEAGSGTGDADLADFTNGMQTGLDELGARLIGGNVSSRAGGFSAHVTAIGRQSDAPGSRLLYRNGARPGDGIYVTGNLGSAAAAIRALAAPAAQTGPIPARLLDAFRHPTAHIREGLILAESGWATSAIDVSDGLAADLGHICKASGAGAIIDTEALPIADQLISWVPGGRSEIEAFALAGGEDYVLLFTASDDPARAAQVASRFDTAQSRFWRIGTITAETQLKAQRAGRTELLRTGGFDHFRGAPR